MDQPRYDVIRSALTRMRKLRCDVEHRGSAAIAALTGVLWAVVLVAGAAGQAFWPKDTPTLPRARTGQARKAKLPPYTTPRTPDGVPDLQGNWGGAGVDN